MCLWEEIHTCPQVKRFLQPICLWLSFDRHTQVCHQERKNPRQTAWISGKERKRTPKSVDFWEVRRHETLLANEMTCQGSGSLRRAKYAFNAGSHLPWFYAGLWFARSCFSALISLVLRHRSGEGEVSLDSRRRPLGQAFCSCMSMFSCSQ
jgi:hypothetical protein